MSIIIDQVDKLTGRYIKDSAKVLTADSKSKDLKLSNYTPSDEERECRAEFLKDFRNSWQTMHLARPELNDMSLYQRYIIDMLAFNTYQENDGNPMLEDRLGGWQSQAMRPIIRNKAISIAAHRTARTIVPKINAFNSSNEIQEDVAKVMTYLVDWAREQANYPFAVLYRVIASLYSPISWGITEYVETYRKVKDKRINGKWTYKEVLDEKESGFKHTPLACDAVYFPNFYEKDCQKQDYLILRQVMSYDRAVRLYPKSLYPKMEHVYPGVIVTMDDANRGFYHVYDPHMRQEEVEVVIRWKKATDSKEIMVNGVMITDPYAPNPRDDHKYPLDSFYYLPINERCIAGKSLVFALQSDARLANEFYQMISDGTKLNLFPPTVTTGSDKVGVDTMVPGLNLAFADKDVKLDTLRTADGQSLRTAMDTLDKIESSLSESSQDPIQQGQTPGGAPSTAYEISRIEQNAATVLGLSEKFFIHSHVIPFGELLLNDILQYLTMADVEKIAPDGGLLYRTFYASEPGNTSKKNKIDFTGELPDEMLPSEKDAIAWKLLEEAGGIQSNISLWKVNPVLFRNHKFEYAVDSDVLNPRSADLTRAYDIETYDRAVANPVADQEQIYKDLLMATNPKTAKNPDKYLMKKQPVIQQPVAPSPTEPIQPNNGKLPQQMNA